MIFDSPCPEPRELRLRLKLTQEDYADLLGVARRTVNRWEPQDGRKPAHPMPAQQLLLTVLELATRETGAFAGLVGSKEDAVVAWGVLFGLARSRPVAKVYFGPEDD